VLQVGVVVPIEVKPIANLAMGCLFLGGPLLALCFAARDTWSTKDGGPVLRRRIVSPYLLHPSPQFTFQQVGIPAEVVNAVGQVGLTCWCVGLGALLATLIKDQNIVVPIAILSRLPWICFSSSAIRRDKPAHQADAFGFCPRWPCRYLPLAHQTTGERVSAGALAGPADLYVPGDVSGRDLPL